MYELCYLDVTVIVSCVSLTAVNDDANLHDPMSLNILEAPFKLGHKELVSLTLAVIVSKCSRHMRSSLDTLYLYFTEIYEFV